MAKLTKEQIMVGTEMVRRGTPMRKLAAQLGVTEGALRYRFRQQAAGIVVDGRKRKPTGVDGFEEAIGAILQRLDDSRVTGSGRPVQARLVCEILRRDHAYGGSYRAVVRHLRRRFGVPPVRALRRVETHSAGSRVRLWKIGTPQARQPNRSLDHRLPLPSRNKQVEQDRAQALLLHCHELERETARESRRHCQSHWIHHDHFRPQDPFGH